MFEKWRRAVVEPRIFGRVLDVGCGRNKVQEAVGIDLSTYSQPDVASRLDSLAVLSASFECVCLIAVLNYVPNETRSQVVQECQRVLTKYGRLVITCTTPIGGFVHRLFRWKQPRGMSMKVIRTLVEENGFRLVYDRPFMLWLNHLYVFGKETQKVESYVPIQQVIKKEMHEGHTD